MTAINTRIYIYDTTLRDGAQTRGVDFSVRDKCVLATKLAEFGVDFIEAGWPHANPKDDAFFKEVAGNDTVKSKLSAFGMTRRANLTVAEDSGFTGLVNTDADHLCIVGKAWDFQVTEALGITLTENINMIADSLEAIKKSGKTVIFDAEHFFDGYKNNATYARQCVAAASQYAQWIVLCDTNGGTLPHEIAAIITDLKRQFPQQKLGIHCHNDTENAVANSLMAVRAGVSMVQGTLNGLGERCGNANLISLIPSLLLKMGYQTGISDLSKIRALSLELDERLNRQANPQAPYVGASAFAHKGGLHLAAVRKNPDSYEHIKPEQVGNQRHLLVSDQAGRAVLLEKLKPFAIADDQQLINDLIKHIKQREFQGYAYDNANASFWVLVKEYIGKMPEYFKLLNFTITDAVDFATSSSSTAKVVLEVAGQSFSPSAQGNGPFDALNRAIRKTLEQEYPVLKNCHLVDYKVRILDSHQGTKATTRVTIEMADDVETWVGVGVSSNIITASYQALSDCLCYAIGR